MSERRRPFRRIVEGEVSAANAVQDTPLVEAKEINPKAPLYPSGVSQARFAGPGEVDTAHDARAAHRTPTRLRMVRDPGLTHGFYRVIGTGSGEGQECRHSHPHQTDGFR